MLNLDDKTISKIHIIGIGGIGMSAIATVLSKMGKVVSGSDLKQSNVTTRLKDGGIKIFVPHGANNINSEIDLVVCSSAIKPDNVEVVASKELKIPVVSRAQILSSICGHEKSIGIAGSHGKTTTTSMATSIARTAGLNPSFMIGGDVNEIGTNADYSQGSLLIVEADESDRTFLDLPLVGAVVTNIENDHLENFHDSFDELQECFYDFVLNINGPVVICVDEPNACSVALHASTKREIITVGQSDADWTYKITSKQKSQISSVVYIAGKEYELQLGVPGEHNVKNALCASALLNALGVGIQECFDALSSFGGVARRFQFRGSHNDITVVDDYGHLPSEVSATLTASKDGGFSRIITIFQPHRYSRTQLLYKEFAKSLMVSDIVIVSDIYSAGEEPRAGVSSDLIVEELRADGHKNAHSIKDIQDIAKFVVDNARDGDLVLTMGAGDVTTYPDVILDLFKSESVRA